MSGKYHPTNIHQHRHHHRHSTDPEIVLKSFWLTDCFPSLWKEQKEKKQENGKTFTTRFPARLFGLGSFFFFFFPPFPGFLHTPPHTTKRCLTSLPQTHPHPTPPSYCQQNSRKLGHDSEHGVVAADARPDLFVVLFGVAHLVELRLRKHKTGACQHLKYCKQSAAKDLKQEAWWKTKQLSLKTWMKHGAELMWNIQ